MRRDGKVYRQRYERGAPTGPVKVIGKAAQDEGTGTKTTFLFDRKIFKDEVDLPLRDAGAALPRDGLRHPRA